MRFLKVFKIVGILFLLKTLTADAQTLDELLKEARQNNPQLQSYAFKIQAAQNRADAAAAWPAPTVGVEFEQVPFNSVNIFNDAISNNLMFSQMFMLGGKLDAMRDAEAVKGKVEEESQNIEALKVEQEIRMAYYSLWAIDRQIDLQRRSESVLKILLESSQAQYETGRAMQADLLMLQAEIASTRAQIEILADRREPQLTMLASFLGRSGPVQITTTSEILEHGNLPNDEVLKAIAQNPEIRRMQRMIDMSRAEITAAEREKFPDLMLGAMFMRMPNGMVMTMFPREPVDPHAAPQPRQTDYMYSLMASVTLPFAPWSRDKYLLKSQEQEANIRATELEIRDMERMLAARTSAAATRFKTAERQQQLFKTSVVPLYRQALEAQISAYQSGRATITSVLEIVRMLQMKEMDFIMAQEEAAMARAEILSITGN
ncbi:MAG TPA: TolC family protein [Patescibacteria group bacterium]|nr:TolC family protein [Patescibacteria group bacterium]